MSESPPPLWTNQLTIHPDRQEPYLRLLHTTIFVSDLDKSIRFYVDQLGFTLVADNRFERNGRWVAVTPPDGTAILALVTPEPDEEEYKLIGHTRQVVFVTEDIDAKYHEWSERGVHFHQPPHTPIWGGMFTTFEDIDGNRFALVGSDEMTREVEARRRSITDKLEADRRAARELQIAKEVQARLFPQTQPPLRTLDYAGTCIQARQVGGDYYDFLEFGRERLGLVIGDISGKGIAAALMMANLQANLRSQCAIALDQPRRFLRSVNLLFYENTGESSYATLFFAEYNDKLQRLRYVNCGHLPGLLLRADNTLERLNSTCTVLGMFKGWDCSIEEQQLFTGDTLILYTDGLTEAFDDMENEFGEQRLIDTLRRHRELPSKALLASIISEVRQFSPHEQHDDLTLIVAKCIEN
ncbi:MAG: SpoIIE family protein phosphatase [Acidobacteria bacterium]|nr:SpoIIE family protein phosphatase [Acidobacteriota bacterium]